MSVIEDRAIICDAIKSGQVPCPAGESLTTIRQRWNAQQCGEFIQAWKLPANVGGFFGTDDELLAEINAPVAAPVPAATGDAGALLAQAVRMLAGNQAIDAQAVREIVRAELSGQVKTLAVSVNDAPVVNVGVTHEKFPDLLLCVAAGVKNIMLVGPSGSGKTHAAHQVAQALGVGYHSQGACILPSDLLGFVDAGGTYHGTQFVRAFEHGGVCILDEIDSYSERASLALNEALSNGSMVAGGRRIHRHADCVVLAGSNTWGNGATLEFTGRARMDGALLGRFPVKLAWDYDKATESAICGNAEIAQKVQAMRERAKAAGIKIQITPRHTVAAAQLVAAGMSHDVALSLTVFAGLSAENVRVLS